MSTFDSSFTSTSCPSTLIFNLPPELIDHVLTFVPPSLQQLTALALLKVFPSHSISRRHLYRHLVIYRAGQLIPLWKALKNDEEMRNGANSLALESWRGDADILNNVMRRLERLQVLMLNIGTNFAPEHLEEMFESPRMELKRMELRFRPYLEQASYYQFLAGSYFDTAIETLTKKWPVCPNFTHLSIVQDLPPRSTVPPTAQTTAANTTANSLANSISSLRITDATSDSPSETEDSGKSTPPTSVDDGEHMIAASKGYTGHGPFGNPFLNEKLGITKPKTFAQPIVFFDTQCLAAFGASPVAANLQFLRIRIPSRDLARVLILHPPQRSYSQTLFPELRYLDISTTNVRLDTTLSALLKQFSKLEHLVLDQVNLFGFTAREKGLELCNDLGNLVVNAGLQRGKEKERQIAAWEVQERVRQAEAVAEAARRVEEQRHEEEQEGPQETNEERRARETQEEIQRNLEIARSRRRHRSAAFSTISLRDRNRRANTTTSALAATSVNTLPLPTQDKLYFVLPPLPTLKSISIGGEAHSLPKSKAEQWEREFHDGWREGLERLLGWAVHVSEKYERSRRKAEEWILSEQKKHGLAGASEPGAKGNDKGKSKKAFATVHTKTKPPTDIRLLRFPFSNESSQSTTNSNELGLFILTSGLIQIDSASLADRSYLLPYQEALSDAQLYNDGQRGAEPQCVFCTIPDCEGPARRGAEGEKVDGRGGMGGIHKKGCGHLLGKDTWGWKGF
ncbi:hypothetical protein L204_102354 [Cryptococcus depauperatus]|nr:hypothetical protein L204_05942 [Cryptococcus depauperatus CBS 7855]